MKLISDKKELLSYLQSPKVKSGTLGLVPTMGALHSGHLSLVKKALADNKEVVVTIFVNPTQFNNAEDLKKYPKTLDDDLALLKTLGESITVFAPSVEELYDGNISSNDYAFDGLDKVMEGEYREGHFNGVATIVEMLFELIRPDRAYFGEKDFQQLQIVNRLSESLPFEVKVIGCPIVREPNGLAMSSRNRRLSGPMRDKAKLIYHTLKEVRRMFGTENATTLHEYVSGVFAEEEEMKLEYFQIADVQTLTPIINKQKNRKYRGFIAVYVEGIRLIDNIALN
ncbi:pantoate--beta-alanine ligase [Muriicola soli]|uniref:Pantothenate synthetase n=1 Tax=Muriicola soli TaxID=2507538 RepID=A0A411ECQ1_9FLAO|nr:pantoate--beta-alanine ligase [Muriicola soli]QBA65170.1 pantoate--beta-alanine ligase [Muriicola soli]